jgi:malate dehydrogenase
MINGKSVPTVISDRKWLESDFISTVQKRGAAIIAARGKSSAASAASACIDHMWRFMKPTPTGQWFSAAVPSDGNSYGIPAGLMFSFPLRSDGKGGYEIVRDLKLSDFAKSRIAVTTKELEDERAVIKDLLVR